ncbi:hypothetical protein BH09ACT1_BH09ACT1_11660 [soil metagenome]
MIKSGILLIAVLLGASLHPLAAAASTPPAPTTGFSSRCVVSVSSDCEEPWTTLTEERSFLREVDARSDRATLERYGTSGEGRGLYDLVIGDEANPVLLMVCSQHGKEPAPRESCLRKAGELALSQNPRVLRLLASVRFVFVPTANPDGRAHNRRGLKDLADPNRHHADLNYPENRGIAELLDRYEPVAAMDTHEMGSSFHKDIALSEPKDPDVDPAIRGVSIDIMAALADHFAAVSTFTTGEYEIEKRSPEILGNQFGLRFAVGGLVESRMAASPAQRVWIQDQAFDVVADYVQAHLPLIEQVTSEARQRSVSLGATALVTPDAPDVDVPDSEGLEADAPATGAPAAADPEAVGPPVVPAVPAPLGPQASPPASSPTPHSSMDPQGIAPTPTPSEAAHPKIEARDSASSLALLLILILVGVVALMLVAVVILRRHSNRST